MLSAIVAVANNNVIGKDNQLIWKLPNDMKWFKERTLGHTVIMGRKTFESLPKLLEDRKHIVLTRDENYKVDLPGVEVVRSIHELKHLIDDEKEHFVIGGAQIYKFLLPYTSKLYITKINEDFEGDAYFPSYDESQWEIVYSSKGIVDEKNKYEHSFYIYNKK
ncbi:dihydrofolate reductase [Desnuesiella massiliensis]|uniref:dihydrofolate reductase n=1 Tax=Desnuesiella massiliensis TaxID=1650662 RepID=UPI0006E46967|nr:dihydrofolate reductase [Desnuesiella massiliensis]